LCRPSTASTKDRRQRCPERADAPQRHLIWWTRCSQPPTPMPSPRSGSVRRREQFGSHLRAPRHQRFCFVAHGAVSIRLPLCARSGSPVAVAASGVEHPHRSCLQGPPHADRRALRGRLHSSSARRTASDCSATMRACGPDRRRPAPTCALLVRRATSGLSRSTGCERSGSKRALATRGRGRARSPRPRATRAWLVSASRKVGPSRESSARVAHGRRGRSRCCRSLADTPR
jgi:hypothetical protein